VGAGNWRARSEHVIEVHHPTPRTLAVSDIAVPTFRLRVFVRVARSSERTKAAWSLSKLSRLYLALLVAAMAVDRGLAS
jgi:hypothetical protein